MQISHSILPLRKGASASIELSQDKWSVVLSLHSPFNRNCLDLTEVLEGDVPRGGLPGNVVVTDVHPWRKGQAFDERKVTEGGILLYDFDLEIMIDSANGSNPYMVTVTFAIPADRWEEFFNPETFEESET